MFNSHSDQAPNRLAVTSTGAWAASCFRPQRNDNG